MNAETLARKRRTGLLLVHGMGEQRPGAFLGEFRDHFRRLVGSEHVVDLVRHDPLEPSRPVHAAAIDLEDRTIMLYEVHWADLVTPDMARASFDPTQLFVLAWFPWFNKQLKLPGFDSYSQRRVASWTWRLVPLSVLFFLGYVGVKAVPHLWRAWSMVEVVTDRCGRRRLRASAMHRRERRSALDKFAEKNERDLLRHWVESKPHRDCQRLELAVTRSWVDDLFDKYAGDVASFVTSMARLPRMREDLLLARAFGGRVPTDALASELPRDLVEGFVDVAGREREIMLLTDRTKARFEHAAGVAVTEDECTELQVVAHSLGTLVAYHAMNRPAPAAGASAPDGAAAATLTRFHTIGSPLEKIHFFWPQLVAPRGSCPSLMARGQEGRTVPVAAHGDFRWKNYYSVSDKVSGALTRFQGWSGIENHRLAGLGGVLSAHAAYKGHASFLRALADDLGVRVAPPRTGWWRRALAWTWSAWQAVIAPLVFMAVCLLGVGLIVAFSALTAGVFTGLVSLVGFSVQWLFTGTGGSAWYGGLFFWLMVFVFISMAGLVTVAVPAWGKRAARASVSRWWRTVQPG